MGRFSTCLAVVLTFAANSASAETKNGSATFSLICKAEQSVGFDYISNAWQEVKFKPSTYVVTKLNPEANRDACKLYIYNHRSAEPTLLTSRALSNFTDDSFVGRALRQGNGYGCYRIKQLGSSNSSTLATECSERWYGVQGNAHLQHVDCKDSTPTIAFDFDGAFAATFTWPAFVLPEMFGPQDSDKRDSIYLEIGNCVQAQ